MSTHTGVTNFFLAHPVLLVHTVFVYALSYTILTISNNEYKGL